MNGEGETVRYEREKEQPQLGFACGCSREEEKDGRDFKSRSFNLQTSNNNNVFYGIISTFSRTSTFTQIMPKVFFNLFRSPLFKEASPPTKRTKPPVSNVFFPPAKRTESNAICLDGFFLSDFHAATSVSSYPLITNKTIKDLFQANPEIITNGLPFSITGHHVVSNVTLR
ncbi:hypothetical protein LXL04_008730 [Taraxacum kok-saghyz]